jgi:predicted methyltransferase
VEASAWYLRFARTSNPKVWTEMPEGADRSLERPATLPSAKEATTLPAHEELDLRRAPIGAALDAGVRDGRMRAGGRPRRRTGYARCSGRGTAAGLPPPPSAATPVATPEPSPEEKKKAADLRQLHDDRAKWEADQRVELSRWTPELHTESQGLVDKSYPSGKAAIQAIAKGKHRMPGAAERDKFRHPAETLEFFGFKPTMTVLDIGPGEGWYTELLAPALAKRGMYYATSGDPNGPADERSTFYAQRFKAFVEKAPEIYGKVQTLMVDSKAPKLAKEDNTFDLVILMRGVHGMINSNTFEPWLAEIHRALKPGGVLGIEEHRAPASADPHESAKKGYVPEKWVIEQAQAAGFTLAGKSEINANPKDTKDYPEGVWSLPPTFRQGETDHAKYAAIGESDRMTLKFVKTAPKTPKTAAPAAKEPATKEPAKPQAAPAKEAPAKEPAR